MGAVRTTIAQTFNFHGATSRRAFLPFTLLWLGVIILLAALRQSTQLDIWQTGYLKAIAAVATLPMLALSVRRLHDAGRSGLWAVVFPVFGVFLVAALAVLPSGSVDRSRNRPLKRHRLAALLVVLLTLFGLSRLYWAPVTINSSNMVPTLLIGDMVIVTRGTPTRGDVIVYTLADEAHEFVYAGRAIAFEGEAAAVLGGALVLNGVPVDQFNAGAYEDFDAIWEQGGLCSPAVECQLIEEILPEGRAYMTVDIGEIPHLDTTSPRLVPEGHVYVLGDHRDNSLDSRLPPRVGGTGTIPLEDMPGLVRRIAISAPFGRWIDIKTWRWERIWKAVQA